MSGKKVYLTLVAVVTVTLVFEAPTRAQPQAPSGDDGPVMSAIERIHSVVERRAAIVDRVLAASKLLDESKAARKQGELERAASQLQQAEAIATEIESAERSYLLDELASAIAAERAASSPGQPKTRTSTPDAQKFGALFRPALARYGLY